LANSLREWRIEDPHTGQATWELGTKNEGQLYAWNHTNKAYVVIQINGHPIKETTRLDKERILRTDEPGTMMIQIKKSREMGELLAPVEWEGEIASKANLVNKRPGRSGWQVGFLALLP